MRHALITGAMAVMLALPAGAALAQQGPSNEASGHQGAAQTGKTGDTGGVNAGGGANATAGSSSVDSNCAAGTTQAGCEDRSRLGTSGSTWGTGDSSGASSMGTTGSHGRDTTGPQAGKPPTVNEPDNTTKSK